MFYRFVARKIDLRCCLGSFCVKVLNSDEFEG